MKDKPRFAHDCTHWACSSGSSRSTDLWWCAGESGPRLASVMARHSSDGPDYIELASARRLRAQAQGGALVHGDPQGDVAGDDGTA